MNNTFVFFVMFASFFLAPITVAIIEIIEEAAK